MEVKENRAFSKMLAEAQDRLAGRPPLEIAEKAHVIFDQEQQVFLFSSLGENITVHYPSYAIEPRLEDSNADLCAVLPFLPQYPVTWKLWLAEEEDEIEGSGRLFLNGSADHYLSIEDAVTVGTIILDRLRQQYEAMFSS